MDAESIKKVHTERSTKYTLELCEKLKKHVYLLDLSDAEKVDLLVTEAAILQASLQYVEITTLIFASQYELFNKHMYPNSVFSLEEIDAYFLGIKSVAEEAYEDWDVQQYIAYPLSINMIENFEGGYRLTNLGRSYVMHVRNDPIHLKYIAQL